MRPVPDSSNGRITHQQRRLRVFVCVDVFAENPFGDEQAVFVPHHHLGAASGKPIPFRISDSAADCQVLARIGFGKAPATPDDLPPEFLMDDHVSQIEHGLFWPEAVFERLFSRHAPAQLCRGNGLRCKKVRAFVTPAPVCEEGAKRLPSGPRWPSERRGRCSKSDQGTRPGFEAFSVRAPGRQVWSLTP
jgi:hypothetical protein